MAGYDGPIVGVSHPLDAEMRARLRGAGVNQADFARRIGRSQAWLNKYMHGAGNATIDDVVRMMALLIGTESGAESLSRTERRLLKAWRSIPEERQEDALIVLETIARGHQPRQTKSNAPAGRTSQGTGSTGRGTRKAAGERS